MKYRTRTYYTDSQKALMWERWKAGWTLHQIGKLFDRPHTSIQNILARTGGIRPTFGFCAPVCATSQADGAEPYASPSAADQWMQQWILASASADPNVGKAPNGALFVGRFADPMYYTASIIGWDPSLPNQIGKYPAVSVPIGFVTDLASIPRMAWTLLRPDGQYAYAAIVHDYLYWDQYLPKETADDIFRLLMEDFKVDSATVFAIYNAVHLAGQAAWDANAKLKAAGEKRFLKLRPTDPTQTWADWKMRPGVFST